MTCNNNANTCNTDSLFASTREARLEAIAKEKREEEKRREQIERLNNIRQAIAIRDAKEQARFKALQDAEKAFKIRERDILEKQLEETLAAQKRMQDQYQEFVTTTEAIAKMLQNPADLFKSATISGVEEFEDYFKLTYKDGRVVKLPTGAVDFILRSKMNAINELFDCHTKEIKALETELKSTNENVSKMADLFKQLVSNVATHETDQKARMDAFECAVNKKVAEIDSNIGDLAESFKEVVNMVQKLEQVVSALVVTD